MTEAGGGLMLAVGLLTPLAAAMIVSVMLVATVTVHLAKGFFAQNGGYEYPLALATGALAVAFTGPGAMSLDAVLGIDWSGNGWGVTALVLALVGGGAQLLTRTRSSPAPIPAH
jgi:putative oxidoreductase